MTHLLKVYLAGPEVFLRDAIAIGAAKKAICAQHGFQGLFPFDNEVEARPGIEVDRIIYEANLGMMRSADFGVFNLTPFRGPSADVGTVFELGLMTGMAKPCLGYANTSSGLLDRVRAVGPVSRDEGTGSWRDAADMSIEDFGNCDNLMIDSSLEASGASLVRRPASADAFRDLDGFVDCLRRAAGMFRTRAVA